MTKKPDTSVLLPDESTLAARRRALEAELRPPRRRRRRAPSRRLAVALVALLALGGGAAWATGVFSAREISFQAGMACYSEARLSGGRLSVTLSHTAADPVAKCEKYWREGVVDTTLRRLGREGKIDYPPDPYPPHLVACAQPGSGIAVFPGPEEVCQRLGFEPLPDDYEAPGREAARAYTSWNRILARRMQVLESGRCRAPEPLAARARKLLAAGGYQDVSVRISGEGPCAKGVEPRGRAIEVVTTSRHEDKVSEIGDRAGEALSTLFERASLQCIEPVRFGALARDALRRAGLAQVGAVVEQRFWPCAAGYGFSPEKLLVYVGASDRKTWRINRKAFLRYQRRLSRSAGQR